MILSLLVHFLLLAVLALSRFCTLQVNHPPHFQRRDTDGSLFIRHGEIVGRNTNYGEGADGVEVVGGVNDESSSSSTKPKPKSKKSGGPGAPDPAQVVSLADYLPQDADSPTRKCNPSRSFKRTGDVIQDVDALYKTLTCLYAEQGFELKEAKGCCGLVLRPFNEKGRLDTGGGMLPIDTEVMLTLADELRGKIKRIWGVGNAFGLSTLSLAMIFPSIPIDVIDAEAEGTGNKVGSQLTRRIAKRYNLDIQLTSGYSPQDIPKSLRGSTYELAFIDGLHTIKQQYDDFAGIHPYLAGSENMRLRNMTGTTGGSSGTRTTPLNHANGTTAAATPGVPGAGGGGPTAVVLHDVLLANMQAGIPDILKDFPGWRATKYQSINAFLDSKVLSAMYSNKYGTYIMRRDKVAAPVPVSSGGGAGGGGTGARSTQEVSSGRRASGVGD